MRTGTKFWLAVMVLGLQVALAIGLLVTGKFTEGMVIPFLAAPVTTLTAFGILNVAASGQAAAQGKLPVIDSVTIKPNSGS